MATPAMSFDAATQALLTEGSPFETTREVVNGNEMTVFKNRPPHLRQLLAESVGFGDAELAVWDTGVRWSFVEHERKIASVAAAFADQYGIGKGSRVAILGANSPEWVLAAWATIVHGGIVVAMNGWWQGDEIRYALELTEPDLLIADRRRLDRLDGVDPGVTTIVIEDDFAPLLAHAPDAPLPTTPLDEDDPAAIMFTSGTTGRPKGAICTHRNFLAFIQMSFFHGARTAMQYPPDPDRPPMVSIASSPLFHVSGLQSVALMGPASGAKTVWTTGRFDPLKVFRLTKEEGVTRWGGITTQIFRLLDHPEFDPEEFRQITATGGGGSTFSPELQRMIREKLPQAVANFNIGYGSTECAGLCTMVTDDTLVDHPDSVGWAIPPCELSVRDDDGDALPDDTEGNICVRGPNVMLGYWNNPEATAESILDGGWLRTGDIGRMVDGEVFLASRKRDMIIRGGENVYPVEIENRLDDHPDVAESAVIGVDHRELGQEVKAIVVARPGTALDPDELRNHVAETLAYYKVPTHIDIVDEPLPRNATGKVLKHVLAGEGENTFIEE